MALRLGGAMPLRPLAGDLVWDVDGARPVTAREAHEGRWRLHDLVLPLPRPGVAVVESGGRLTMEAVLRDLVPQEHDEARPHGLPEVRHMVSVPLDMTWEPRLGSERLCSIEDVVQGPCDCDLIRLGHASRGRAVRETRPGLLLRATLRRNEAAEALLREVFKADSLRFSIVFLLFSHCFPNVFLLCSSDFDPFVLFFACPTPARRTPATSGRASIARTSSSECEKQP